MDCETASKVWNHEGGFIAGVRQHLPGVIEHLDNLVTGFIHDKEDEFNQAVQEMAPGNYYVEHAPPGSDLAELTHDVVGDEAGGDLLDRHFSEKYGQPIHLANICCGSCAVMPRPLEYKEKLELQMAAINAPH
jgi:hypothetical protein